MQATYTSQSGEPGDWEATGSLCYGQTAKKYSNLSYSTGKPMVIRGNGTCFGPGPQAVKELAPAVLCVAAFLDRPDDATRTEGGMQIHSQSFGPPMSVLHRKAGHGFREYNAEMPQRVHRVFVYLLFFDELLMQGERVMGGIANGTHFQMTHDDRNVL